MGCGDSRVAPNTSESAASYRGRHTGLHNTGTRTVNSTVADRIRAPNPQDAETIQVKAVDLKVATNTKAHHTDEFDITEEKPADANLKGGQLVIRRGQDFEISITFNRPYDQTKDELRLAFAYGPSPNARRGTLVEFILSAKDNPKTWGAMILSKNDNSFTLRVMTPAHCQVGKWKLMVDVVKRSDTETVVYRYEHSDPIRVLFNPWCKDDEVYLKDDSLLKEYILNDTGKIYAGNHKRISYKPWTFGQFSGTVLDCALYLLEVSETPAFSKGDPIVVSRKMSAMVNAPDDNGILVGNWSGDYGGGTPPLDWTGSVAILDQYYQSKRPVKYGQCWVFSGILTTVCRALGIPARSVTNFASAHDTDASITIDKHFSYDGTPLKDYDSDSVWNFHVWNDVWMARPDLPNGYGGWQAIDATPQETSNGIYCMGPMPLLAIKRGETRLPYDGPFVFAEVNADRVYWIRGEDGEWTKGNHSKYSIGKHLSTKLPNSEKREDVTDQYKYKEGSDEGEAAVRQAIAYSSTLPIYEDIKKDVEFTISVEEDVYLGDDVTVTLRMKNTSDSRRTVDGKMEFYSMYYTGVTFSHVKHLDLGDTKVEAGKEAEIKFEISVNDYQGKLTDHCNCHVTALCIVKETNQTHADEEEVRLRKPKLSFTGPEPGKAGKVGEKVNFEVTFQNPLPVPLTRCELRVDGPGLQRPIIYKQPNVPAKATFTGKFDITPAKRGQRQVIVYFNSAEIEAVTGERTLTVN